MVDTDGNEEIDQQEMTKFLTMISNMKSDINPVKRGSSKLAQESKKSIDWYFSVNLYFICK